MVSGTARGEEDAGRNSQARSSSHGWRTRAKERMALKKQRTHRSGGTMWFYKAGQSQTRPDSYPST